MNRTSRPLRLLFTVLALPLVACGSSKSSTEPDEVPLAADAQWLAGSPEFKRRIEDQADRMPYLQKPEEFVNTIQFFVSAGEPAYTALLELAAQSDPKVASIAMASLGQTGDSRLVPYIRQIPWPDESQSKLRYERARCLVKLGDWQPIGVLVDGLEDESLLARAQCFKALRQASNETFQFHPQGTPDERAAAVERWRVWVAERELDPMLNKQ